MNKILNHTVTIIPVITIDGPSGTGKGTISQMLAKKLGWHYLDSGSMFRVLAYAASQSHIKLDDENALTKIAETMELRFDNDAIDGLHIFLAQQDITDAIRNEQISNLASQIAILSKVRTTLANKQRTFRQSPGLVTDGRDMGTVIFPDATIKFFLEASAKERARRRYLQLKNKQAGASLGEILTDIERRDARDISRSISPLKPATDAIIIDTTLLNVDQVFAKVAAYAKNKL